MAIWKAEQVRAYCVAFLKAGFALIDKGVFFCGSDDVEITTNGQGIAGSAIASMRNAGLISDYFGFHPDQGIAGGRRKSKRTSANARKVALYSLNVPVAREWLTRNGISLIQRQTEMALAGL
jgi:hypothetical protein